MNENTFVAVAVDSIILAAPKSFALPVGSFWQLNLSDGRRSY